MAYVLKSKVKFIYLKNLHYHNKGVYKIPIKKHRIKILFSLSIWSIIFIMISSSSISELITADDIQIINQKTITLTFSKNDFSFSTQDGYDTIHIVDGGYLTEIGKPKLPIIHLRIALPEDMKVTQVCIKAIKQETIEGSYLLYPAQPAYQINTIETQNRFIQPDAQTYRSGCPYPSKYVEFNGQTDLAGQSIATFTVYPVRYIPSQRKVSFASSITFTIEGTSGYQCGDYLPLTISEEGKEMYQQMIQTMVYNPDEVLLRYSPTPQPTGVDPGDYDYVIITQETWADAFQPLADWKTKKGIPATIVTTSWIYNNGGYSGTNIEKIKAFVQDAHANWGTIYFLLGGDTDKIPCQYRTFSLVDPDPVPNDTYYADYDNDWVCEVHVGRASVTGTGTGTGGIRNFINKVLTYEKNPPLTNYAKHAGFFGFDLDSTTHTEQCKISIRNSYIPTSWTMTTVYDSQGGNHKTNVIAAINGGQNLMNHADHSNVNFMGTGYINHGLGLGNSDMDALINGNKQGILYSMGCLPAAYDESNSIAEHFVRNSNGGGIAFIGNSRYGWYNQGTYNTLSMKYDAYFFKSLFPENNYKLGACFSDHKNDAYQYDFYGYYKYCFTELTLLGDPELPIWKDNPIQITVTHQDQLPVGSSSFTVSVNIGGSPVNQASVCLWKGSDIYEIGTTNSGGEVTFNISPSTTGTMYVTVTKQDHLPYESQVIISDGTNNPPHTPMKPSGPENGGINIEYTYTTSTIDPEQDQVWYQWSFGIYTTSWIGPYDSAAEIQMKYTWETTGTYEVKVKAKDNNNLESGWSIPLIVTITSIKPLLSIGEINGGLFAVSSEIQNIGEIPVTNINWRITIDGTFIISGQTLSANIPSLGIGNKASIENAPILGFGKIIITITVSADGIPEITKTANGYLFFIYIIL
ncbi:hypothetical protein AYK25_02995 [Thermoplasmatales archaeon SM1-50]|nr:MAG: hypothetical protein AYK25_02995 [Thermoplasmatales archaeon SM1-50]